jgi:hypothetical protein
MDSEAVSTLVTLLLDHRWAGAATIVIFFVMRLFKADMPIPLVARIPSKLRTLLVVVLGFAGAGLQAFAAGAPWQKALAENLIGALLAVLMHDGLIEYLRGGRELFAKPKPEVKPSEEAKNP